MSQNHPSPRLKETFVGLWLGFACLLVGSLAGCEPNPLIKPPKPVGKIADPVAAPVAGDVQQQPEQREGQAAVAGDQPVPKTPLARGLTELLDNNPALEDDVKGPLREQLQQADDILSEVKGQNRAVLREVNRQQRHRRNDSPNIVMIIADQLGVDELNDDPLFEIETPYIDQLVKLGTRFTQFYAASPDPVAAHWCLATGRRPDEATAWSNTRPILQSEDLTIAEVMWQAGYTTGVFGDWGVLGPQGPATPVDQGFDTWLGAFGPVDQPQPFPVSVLHNGKALKLTKNSAEAQGQLAQDFYIAEAIDFIDRAQRPAFVQIHVTISEAPATTGELAKYADRNWSDELKSRAVAISRLDQGILKLMTTLRQNSQLGNTIFVLTSATASSNARHMLGATASSTTLRGGPGELYEGGLRVPLLICGTKRIPAGHSAVVSAAWDLAPTIYDLVGAQKRPVAKSGQSLRNVIQPNAKLPTRFLYWEAKHGSGEIAARWQNWKALRHANQPAFELYDLAADPGEMHDVATEHPDVIAEIQKRIMPISEQAKR